MADDDETMPLLPTAAPATTRIHFLDNLRTVLVILVIFHHAAILSAPLRHGRDPREDAIIAVFTTTNEAFLWNTFYLVSGCSSAVALEAEPAPSECEFVERRMLRVGVPAVLWGFLGRKVRFAWVFVFIDYERVRDLLTGPVMYVALLLVFDGGHLALRRKGVTSLVGRSTVMKVFIGTAFAALLLLSSYVNALPGGTNNLPSSFTSLFSSFDFPLPDAPVSCAVTFFIGANYSKLKDVVPSVFRRVAFPLLLVLSYATLHIACVLSPSIRAFSDSRDNPLDINKRRALLNAGLNRHTTAFVLWDTLSALLLPISFVAFFSSTPMLSTHWSRLDTGRWKKPHVLVYVHMIPIFFGRALSFYLGLNDDVIRTLFIGLFGVFGGWKGITLVEAAYRWGSWLGTQDSEAEVVQTAS
ncbi:hypothetical protein NLJ89_g6825 [Agrocybe chaxingu]|uniref:Acyltransferase 3 domain-containing protein n=1 Tax=Agrocybe chaxingu TaxID=84603 RepID=A0A9W8JXV6_9AGAR|nr:hypothetical protein NLJ89_g6825 [Agrocybe chaxingu]